MNEAVEAQPATQTRPSEIAEESIAEIVRALRGLRFGSVHVIVQDGLVIQIDRTEKRRIRTRP